LAELPSLGSVDEAAQWAKRILPVKNTLTLEHASDVEAAFAAHLVRIDGMADPDTSAPTDGGKAVASAENNIPNGPVPGTAEDRGVRLLRPVRRRDKDHLKFVALQPCLLCQRQPSDAHHLRFAQPRAMGRKVSDEFTVPLCRTHHRQVHRVGNEVEWWTAMDPDIDPLEVAKELWEQSHNRIHPVQPVRTAEIPAVAPRRSE
jgi:hypothetical protein